MAIATSLAPVCFLTVQTGNSRELCFTRVVGTPAPVDGVDYLGAQPESFKLSGAQLLAIGTQYRYLRASAGLISEVCFEVEGRRFYLTEGEPEVAAAPPTPAGLHPSAGFYAHPSALVAFMM